MGLIRLAAFHNMYIEGMEERLAQIVEDPEADQSSRVEAAVAYADIKEQSRLNGVNKSRFNFSKKREKKFIDLIAGDTPFEKLNSEEPLQAVTRYGVLHRNKIKFEFSVEEDDWDTIIKEVQSHEILRKTKWKDDNEKQVFYHNLNEFETAKGLEDNPGLRDAILDALIVLVRREKYSIIEVSDILNLSKDLDKTFIIDGQYSCFGKNFLLFNVSFSLLLKFLNKSENRRKNG